MRFSLFKAAVFLAAAASSAMAQTPPNFEPSTKNNLEVKFGSLEVLPGRIEPQKGLSDTPALALKSPKAPMYIAFMMDISIVLKPGASPTTLIHWIRPYLWSENGSLKSTNIAALVPYMPPGPPPGQTHDYVVFLFEQPPNFKVPDNYKSSFANITASVNNRIGFNLTEFTDATELKQPVAANWFRVSTPAQSTTSASPAGASPTFSQGISTSSGSRVLTVMGKMGLVIAFIGLGDFADMFWSG
ncbi:phosphatidylethanolamine-binding protein-like protein [Fusarium austroafricanum]|uniref:Phosphatidylethanolamine-binding protein-like protein n=1 Tax=Fusarium austroafricanum TaxID=2364996 RepID=A0A8H4JNZ9_9HYPO|nr:phosphatidylethanolamine-binding protein-like protein [Fusarium austroafricanum]